MSRYRNPTSTFDVFRDFEMTWTKGGDLSPNRNFPGQHFHGFWLTLDIHNRDRRKKGVFCQKKAHELLVVFISKKTVVFAVKENRPKTFLALRSSCVFLQVINGLDRHKKVFCLKKTLFLRKNPSF